jgi:membrane glycosyltransferase
MNVLQTLRSERDRLQEDVDRLNAAIKALAGSATSTGRPAANERPALSAAARARIAKAQRARWAKLKAGGAKKQNVVSTPKRKGPSAAARKRIAAAQRARWAKIRANKVK